MRHVLHEQATRRRKAIELARQPAQRSEPEMIRQPFDPHRRIDPRSAIPGPQSRGPDLDGVAGCGKALRDEARVVADATGLRRVLAGEDVPIGHERASSICATFATLLTGSIDASAGRGISLN